MTLPNRPGRLPTQYVQAGDAWPGFEFTVKDDQDQPVDLSTWSNWQSQFRPTRGSGQKVDLTVDASNAATGTIAVSASGPDVQQMGGSGGFDVQATDGGGQVHTFVEGDIDWIQDYTR